MHATSTVDSADTSVAAPPPPEPARSDRRSFARAFADIRDGFHARELWAHLGWQDIKQRYRRSVIGPFWITLSMGVTALGLGLLYSQLFGSPLSTFLPYVTAGFVIWNFIVGCVTEGTDTFIANEGLIKHLPAPLTVYVFRTVWRQTLMFCHNLIVYLIMLVVFWRGISQSGYVITHDHGIPQPGLSWTMVLAIPGFLLLAINACWVALLFGVISTRFRDIPQVVTSLINLVFFATPIMWSTDILAARFNGRVTWQAYIAQLNPMYHMVQVVRAPLIGAHLSWVSWVVVIGCAVIGWALALVVLRNYRSRVSYWV